MTEQAPDRIWSGIDIPQTLAGALAAVCAAVAGSFLGVAGTLTGAAIASIVGSVGTEVYARSINKGTRKLRTLAPTFIKAPAAVGTPPVEAASEEDSPSHTTPPRPPVQVRWGRVATAAAVLFLLAMASLTVVELMAGQSMASILGHTTTGSTTFSSVTDGGDADEDPAPVVSGTPSDETTPTDAPSTEPTEAPTTTELTTEPTKEPTTEVPTTQAPEQAPPADTQTNPANQGQGPGQVNQ